MQSCFSYGDYPLVLRKILYAAFDTDDKPLIREAADWGREVGMSSLSFASMSEQTIATGLCLLEKIKQSEGKKSEWYGRIYLSAVQIQKTFGSHIFVLHPLKFKCKSLKNNF